MPNPRKIVLILGNGFDLDLGLKTSYKDFWESEFCPKAYPAPLIRHLNQRWKEDDIDTVKWYDLENELFEYAVKGDKSDVVTEEERAYLKENSDVDLNNKYRFMGVDDTFKRLADKGYIVGEEVYRIGKTAIMNVIVPYREDYFQSVIWRDRQAFQLIKNGLCAYLNTLTYDSLLEETMAHEVLSLMGYAREEGHCVKIYSFNYTKTILEVYKDIDSIVDYVHGKCSSSIIVGTGDTLEVGDDYDFFLKSFDRDFKSTTLVKDLGEADNVIIFGHSIGENDRQYFKAFFKRQTDYSNTHEKDITIFTHNDVSMMEIKRALQKMTDGNISTLYGLNNLQIIKTERSKEKERAFMNYHKHFLSFVASSD